MIRNIIFEFYFLICENPNRVKFYLVFFFLAVKFLLRCFCIDIDIESITLCSGEEIKTEMPTTDSAQPTSEVTDSRTASTRLGIVKVEQETKPGIQLPTDVNSSDCQTLVTKIKTLDGAESKTTTIVVCNEEEQIRSLVVEGNQKQVFNQYKEGVKNYTGLNVTDNKDFNSKKKKN